MNTQPLARVLDVETTTKNAIGNNPGSAFCPDNKIVLYGSLNVDTGAIVQRRNPTGWSNTIDVTRQRLFVGHAIGFDLHHMMKEAPAYIQLLPTATIWDTQLAEYLLSGQQHQWPTLDECSVNRGGNVKDDRISTMWDAGVQTEDIPEYLLNEYHKEDLYNTKTVFLSQIVEANEKGMLPLIKSQMEALLCTIEMTWNGMHIDQEELAKQKLSLERSINFIDKIFEGIAKEAVHPDWQGLSSPKSISALLFGCKYTETVKEPDGLYKNGNPRSKKVDYIRHYSGLGIPPKPEWLGAHGIYNTGDEVLESIKGTAPKYKALIENIQHHRDANKQLGTYVEGVLKNLFPDGKIHHGLNHCVTKTGRLSSSNPNLQNVTDGIIKRVFISRSETGMLIEADFAQLEIVALAYLSGDRVLIEDLESGKDIHTELYKDMYGREPTTSERKQFKRLSFGLVYGAGPKTLAEQGKVSIAEAKKFIETFYNRYPQVKEWHDRLIEEAKAGAYNSGGKTKLGLPSHTYVQTQPTGRLLEYHQYDNDWKRNAVSFSPTELKNYPVQSLATGDIVPLVLGKLYRKIKNHPVLKDKLLLINTVHDSVVFDLLDETYVTESIEVIKSVMEQAPVYFKETFGKDFSLRLSVGIKTGKNWYDMNDV